MRAPNNIPRIVKINEVNGLRILAVFNTGEWRWIDFQKVLPAIGVDQSSPAHILFNPVKFKKVELQNHTLSWKNVSQYITQKNGKKIKVPFEIGADVLYEFSEPDIANKAVLIGDLIKKERQKAGITQEALARRIGTTSNYISRIENERSGMELRTLKKIVEVGFGKQLKISIK